VERAKRGSGGRSTETTNKVESTNGPDDNAHRVLEQVRPIHGHDGSGKSLGTKLSPPLPYLLVDTIALGVQPAVAIQPSKHSVKLAGASSNVPRKRKRAFSETDEPTGHRELGSVVAENEVASPTMAKDIEHGTSDITDMPPVNAFSSQLEPFGIAKALTSLLPKQWLTCTAMVEALTCFIPDARTWFIVDPQAVRVHPDS